jgi:hypothetical protein
MRACRFSSTFVRHAHGIGNALVNSERLEEVGKGSTPPLIKGVMTMTSSAKISALVAGSAVIGAGLGLLLAPQSGADTRRQVRQYAKRAQVQAARVSRSVRAGFEKAIEQGKSLQDTPSRRPVEAA